MVEAPDLNGFVGVLSGAGIAFEAEGMEALYMAICKEVEADELDIEDLENVAGGMVFITATTVVLFAIGLYAAYKGGEALGRWASNLRCRW